MALVTMDIRKTGLLLMLITMVVGKDLLAQNNNPCGKSWSEWKTVWTGQSGQVDYQLEFPSKNCGCGWKFVRIRHTLPYRAFVSIWLEGVDCDGKFMTSSFDAETMGGEISDDKGDWHSFKSVSGVAKVQIEYEDGDKRIKIVTTRSGTTRYINGMSEKAYNQQQQQKSTSATTSSTTRPSGGTTNNSSTNTTRTNSSTSRSTVSQVQAQSAEQKRQQQEEAYRRQQETERRQREEAIRQNELRYQSQLQEITRKSEARAQSYGAIMDGFAGIISNIQKNKIENRLREDDAKRSNKISEYKRMLAEGGYELIDCKHCNLDGFDRCGQCKSKGSIKCSSCNGEAGKRCSSCNGTGKRGYGPYQVACFDCSGTGNRKCLPCGNEGSNICFLCGGRREVQCGHCEGTGKMLKEVSMPVISNYSTSPNPSDYASEEGTVASPLIASNEEGSNFLAMNRTKPGVKTTASGLQYQVLRQGKGKHPKMGDTLTYHIKWFDINGSQISETYSSNSPVVEALEKKPYDVFDANLEAFPLMSVGSKYKFFIPAHLAYKDLSVDLGDGKVLPAGSVVIVEYELLGAKRPLEEMMKEEFKLDSILLTPIVNELTMSFTGVNSDSVFGITIIRSYDEKKRMQIDLLTHIHYREEDGYYSLDAYRSKADYDQKIEGSGSNFFYIPTFAAYQKIVRELEARAKKEGLRVVRLKEVIYMNEKPKKKKADHAILQSKHIDAAWSAKYDSCLALFEQERYFECYQLAQALSQQTGRKNQKVEYLVVFAGYLSITNGKINSYGDGLSPNHPMNYQNLMLLNGQANHLLSLATPADTTSSWYSSAKFFEETTRALAQDYIYQKDRTPEKVVQFLDILNSNKFIKKPIFGEKSRIILNYSIYDSILTIGVTVSQKLSIKRVKDTYYKGELRINLKQVALSKLPINREKEKLNPSYLFKEMPSESNYIFFKDQYQTDSLPVLISRKYNSAMLYRVAEDEKESRVSKKFLNATDYPLQTYSIFQFFNEKIPSFKEEQYDQKIEEAFQYLIDYFNK